MLEVLTILSQIFLPQIIILFLHLEKISGRFSVVLYMKEAFGASNPLSGAALSGWSAPQSNLYIKTA